MAADELMYAAAAFVSGLFAGVLHVWSGPDHLAAVAPLSASRPPRAWSLGVRWGLGHSGGVLLIGSLALLFREALPVHSLSSVSERLVGVVLIAIGLWGLRKAFANRVHSHSHSHGESCHTHFHVHDAHTSHSPGEGRPHTHHHAALAIGALHGLAGSSHFLGVLPALAFPTTLAAAGYLFGYALGTVMAMAGFTSLVGAARRWRGLAGEAGYRRLMCGCSSAALVVGLYWVW